MRESIVLVVMGGAGLLLHFLTRYGEFWRGTDKIGPVAYIKLDPIGWIASLLGSLAFWLVLPELDSFLSGLPLAWSVGQTPLGALLAGYVGSSVTPKVLAMLANRVGVR